jgi:hypothetical protein
MKNLAHSASFESLDKDAPSKAGTKHLAPPCPAYHRHLPRAGLLFVVTVLRADATGVNGDAPSLLGAR